MRWILPILCASCVVAADVPKPSVNWSGTPPSFAQPGDDLLIALAQGEASSDALGASHSQLEEALLDLPGRWWAASRLLGAQALAHRLGVASNGSALAKSASAALAGAEALEPTPQATLRAAAGLAFLALGSDAPGTVDQSANALAVQSAVGDLIGWHGGLSGDGASDEMLAMVVPFFKRWNQVHGEDLSQGTSLGKVAHFLNLGGDRVFIGGTVSDAWKVWAQSKPEPVNDPWAAWWSGSAILSGTPSADNAAYDPAKGLLVWHGNDTKYVIHAGTPNYPQAAGTFTVDIAGVPWIDSPLAQAGSLDTGNPSSGIVIRKGPSGNGPARAIRGAKPHRVFAGEYNGNLGHKSYAFEAQGRTGPFEELEDGEIWNTIAWDTHPDSGALATGVVVTGARGFVDRERVWVLDLGTIPANYVNVQGNRWTVTRLDTKAIMTGKVVFPADAKPTVVERGGRTYLEIGLSGVGTGVDEAFENLLMERVTDLRRIGPDGSGDLTGLSSDLESLDMDLNNLDALESDEDRAAGKVREQQAKSIYTKVLRINTSSKMGAPKLTERVRQTMVAVMAIHEGQPPEITVAPMAENHLLTIGKRKVTLWEYWLEFSALKGGAK